MNRYILQGIAEDLRQNKQVVLFVLDYRPPSYLTHSIADCLQPGYIKKTTDEEVRTQGGGVLRVLSYRTDVSRVHGLSPDVVIIPEHAYSPSINYLEYTMGAELIEY